jgi:hypothetical protein
LWLGRRFPFNTQAGKAKDIHEAESRAKKSLHKAAAIRPNSGAPPLEKFRFQFWPWHLPDRTERAAAFSNAHKAKNFRFCLFWEIERD